VAVGKGVCVNIGVTVGVKVGVNVGVGIPAETFEIFTEKFTINTNIKISNADMRNEKPLFIDSISFLDKWAIENFIIRYFLVYYYIF
jgi:hypothetical protein